MSALPPVSASSTTDVAGSTTEVAGSTTEVAGSTDDVASSADVASGATDVASEASGTPAVVDTPKLLNRWQLLGTAIVLAFGILSATLQFVGWSADGRAADDTEQLVRVQEIQSSLLRADALATNAFLVRGLEPTDQRAEYDAAIESVLTGIADAAEAQPADREALAALNVAVSEYVATVAQARTNNRLGLPIGAEYLATASSDLRTHALPILEALVEANAERAESSMQGQHPFLLILVGLAALAGLWWLNRELARAFRRHINVGVALAAAIVAVTTLLTAALALVGSSSNDDLRDGDFRVALDQAAARTAANDAKANESLRLVKRGSGSVFEDEWEAAAQIVTERGAEDLSGLWQEYVDAHGVIVELDDQGKWERAVAEAIGDGETQSTATLDAYDAASQEVTEEAAARAADALRDGRWVAFLVGLLTLLASAAAVVFVARGIGQRRREFA